MKIAVVGSLNMDLTVTAPRIPLKGETILGHELQYHPGGKGANQAFAIARLGTDVTMFGCVGKDAFGNQLVDNLKSTGAETKWIKQIDQAKTGIALITVGEHDNTIVVVPGANSYVDINYINTVKDELLQASLVMMQLEIPSPTVQYVCQICHEANVPVMLNPAPAILLDQDLINQVSYLTPNEHEAQIIFNDTSALEDLLRRHPEKLVVTRGAQGAIVADNTGHIINVPAIDAVVVDTTGAGDTFNGALAVALTEGQNMSKALQFANTAAGLSVSKLGAQSGMPTRAEVEELLKTRSDP